jgi:hypothetical protein
VFRTSVNQGPAGPGATFAVGFRLLRADERIPDIADRLDGGVAQLGPEPGDIDVEDVRGRVERVSPDILMEVIAGADLPGALHHALE